VRASARARITVTADLETAAQDGDLLSEAVPEDPELKGRVLAEFNAACPLRTIFMTNTSTLLPSQFAGRPAGATGCWRCTFTFPFGSTTSPT